MPTLVKATGVKDNLTTGLLSAIPFLVAVVAISCVDGVPIGAASAAGTW